MAFLTHISRKPETNVLKVAIIHTTDPIKEKISFFYYRLAKGILGILSYTKKGIRLWFRTKRPAYRQLCLKLAVWIDKKYVSQSPIPAGLIKVPLFAELSFDIFQKNWQIGPLGKDISFLNYNLRKLKTVIKLDITGSFYRPFLTRLFLILYQQSLNSES